MASVFDEPPEKPVVYAIRRRPDRICISATFPLPLVKSRNYGKAARFIRKVFDEPTERAERDDPSSNHGSRFACGALGSLEA